MQTHQEQEVIDNVKLLIEKLQIEKGYSKKQICSKLGIGLSTLSDHLSGKTSFKLSTLIKLSFISRVKTSDIICGSFEFAREGKKFRQFADPTYILAFFGVLFALSATSKAMVAFSLSILLLFWGIRHANQSSLNAIMVVVYCLGVVFTQFMTILKPTSLESMPEYQIKVLFIGISFYILAIWLIKARGAIALFFTSPRFPSVLQKNKADAPIIGLFIYLIFIDICVLVEHGLRDLAIFSVSNGAPLFQFEFFYNNLLHLKIPAHVLTLFILFIATAKANYEASLWKRDIAS